MKKLTQEILFKWINKQFEIAWHDVKIEDIKDQEEWFLKYEITPTQEEEFREYLKKEMKPYSLPWRLDRDIGRFILGYSLKTKKEDN